MFSFIQSIKQHIIGVKNNEEQQVMTINHNNTSLDVETRDCVIYIRVSSEEQNYEAQKYTCEEYAFNNRLYIKQIYEEKVSAYKGQQQTQLVKLIEENQNCNVVIFSIDRFSRNLKNSEDFIHKMADKKINLLSVKENINLRTAFGKHEFRKLISIAQYESELISERVRNSIKYRKENGIPIGIIPYGLVKFNKKIVKDADEQNIIKFIVKNSKSKSTPERFSKELFVLMRKLKRKESDMVPIIITVEDEEYEYAELRNDEVINITYEMMANVLNDYNIFKREKKWTKNSVARIFKSAVNLQSFNNLRV